MTNLINVDHNQLTLINQIVETLNRALNVRSVLEPTLAQLVKLMSLETAWISLKKMNGRDPDQVQQYYLAAHVNLPPALSLDRLTTWSKLCDCQQLCNQGLLHEAFNQVRCSRLAAARGNKHGLKIHASAPLRSGDHTLGILNVASTSWAAFNPDSLAILGIIGNQIGIALERARLFDLLQERHIFEQAALIDLSRQLLGLSSLDDLVHLIVNEVPRLCEMDACALLLPVDGTNEFEVKAASGWKNDPTRKKLLIDLGQDFNCDRGIQIRPLPFTESLSPAGSILLPARLLQSEYFRTQVMIPLFGKENLTGVTLLHSRAECGPEKDKIPFISLVANQVSIALEQARLRELEKTRLLMEKELAVAREIQVGLLPSAPPTSPGWEFTLSYRPASQLGGDYYDFIEFPGSPKKIGLIIADVVGKGFPASLLMAVTRTVVRAAASLRRNPSDILKRANTLLRKDKQVDFFLSVFCAILDVKSGTLSYATAGHNYPLWLSPAQETCQELAAEGIVLGVLSDIKLEKREIEVKVGDTLIFFTDGFPEAFNGEGEMFGLERLKKVAQDHRHQGAQEIMEEILKAVLDFTGSTPQSDDQTIFVIKRMAENERLPGTHLPPEGHSI